MFMFPLKGTSADVQLQNFIGSLSEQGLLRGSHSPHEFPDIIFKTGILESTPGDLFQSIGLHSGKTASTEVLGLLNNVRKDVKISTLTWQNSTLAHLQAVQYTFVLVLP